MPRDGSGIYHRPVGTDAVPDTTVESTKYNTNVADVETDLNVPRPIVAGGTGGNNATAALLSLGAEFAKQVITNYSSAVFQPGSFYSASSATGAPVAGHAFSGICYVTDANNMFLEARDQDDSVQPGHVWVRQMKAGVWSAWVNRDFDASSFAPFVLKAGDTMTGPLVLPADPTTALQAATKQYADTKVNDTGDTMTGPLVLPGNPTLALQAAPKQYVDASPGFGGVRYDIAQGLTAPQQAQARANIASPILRGYLSGYTLSTAGSSTTFTVQPGMAADNTVADYMTLASAYSKTTAAWAVGSATGSLDTGSIAASAWYHVHAIKRPDTGVVDIAISTNSAQPVLGAAIPAAYTLSRRIGSMLTNASSQWTAFTQFGDEFLWSVPNRDLTSGAFTSTATLITTLVPVPIQVLANVTVEFNNAGQVFCFLSSPDQADTAAGGSAGQQFTMITGVASTFAAFNGYIRTNTSGQFRGRTDVNTGSTVNVFTKGWIDRRGRDA